MLITRKLYLQDQVRFEEGLWTESGESTVILPQGTYELCLHGGGGAGGQNGDSKGGAGGVGKRQSFVVKLSEPTATTFSVGAKGLTKSNGGNGGAAGDSTGEAAVAGAGGGGGKPTWIKFAKSVQIKTHNAWLGADGTLLYTLPDADTSEGASVRVYTNAEINGGVGFGLIVTITTANTNFSDEGVEYTKESSLDLFAPLGNYLYALGGGGGGGGGGKGRQGRYSDGGSGGGGGGYYRFNPETGETVSVAGKKGGKGGRVVS